ncbi:MAG: ABC transporter substrate-binding protein [Lachnospiraceae bacterium]|nr:ABC transporter substrate-binding protein [Lachnospiraceae bacterium]
MRSKLLKKVLGVLAACALTVVAAPAMTAMAEGTVTVGVTSFADTLEPTEQYFSWVITRYAVGETLTKFNEDAELQPCLAESWESSEDGLTWTFKIREGVKFSNGDELTAEAVKASLDRTFAKSSRAPSFFVPTSIEADGQNLIISTEKAIAGVPGCLADPLFLIMDVAAESDNIEMDGPICTGPYAFQEFVPDDHCIVVRNENYWDGEVPLDSVNFKVIGDQTTRSMALQTGEIDIAYNLKAENLIEFEGNPNYDIQQLSSLRATYAFMNQNGPLGDLALRQAFIRGIDRETYCSVLLEGGAIAGKAPIPPTLDYGFDELVDENAYDPESAKAVLAEAGYADIDGDGFVETPEGEKLELNFVIYTSRAELGVYAQAAQASLKEIGLNVALSTVSYETMLDVKESGQYDLIIWNVQTATTGDPENYLRENWYSTSVHNTAGYNNPEVDALIDELATEFDTDARRDLIIQIQQHIMDDAATVFFGYETTFLFSSARVTGVTMFPMDYNWFTKDVKLAE